MYLSWWNLNWNIEIESLIRILKTIFFKGKMLNLSNLWTQELVSQDMDTKGGTGNVPRKAIIAAYSIVR